MWYAAIAADAACRTAQGSTGPSRGTPFHRSGTRIPKFASYRTHSPPSLAVPGGHASHCSVDDENTDPSAHSSTSCGSTHPRSPPGQIGASLPSRSRRPDCHRHVATSDSDALPSVPTSGRRLFRLSGDVDASLSPVSGSYSTHPDAPSNDTFRIALSSAALSTE
eukprot:560505-Rhodomonas_salina.1